MRKRTVRVRIRNIVRDAGVGAIVSGLVWAKWKSFKIGAALAGHIEN